MRLRFTIRDLLWLAVTVVVGVANNSIAADIELSKVFSTSRQDGLRKMTRNYSGEGDQRKFAQKYGYHLEQIFLKEGGLGASNVFLVEAPDIEGAVSATTSVLLGGRSADEPATLNQPNPPHGSFWLVAYIGVSGSSPPHWTAESISVSGKTVRFSYHKAGSDTKDEEQYIYWVPLDHLDGGTYELELYDSAKETSTLRRRVKVDARK